MASAIGAWSGDDNSLPCRNRSVAPSRKPAASTLRHGEARRVGRGRALVTAGVVGMIVAIPAHPAWMAVAGLVLPVPAALAGGALATAVRARMRR